MELISKNCKGLMFSLRENGLGYLSAQCIAEVLADNSYYALLGVPPPHGTLCAGKRWPRGSG